MRASVAFSAADLLENSAECALVMIDIPIGVPARGSRGCDVLARKLLGAPRASSVFPCPVRETLTAETYADAAARSRSVDGRGLTRQAFGILARIADVDATLRQKEEWHGRLREVHPELCYYFWNSERPMMHAKRSPLGATERRALLDAHFGSAFDEVRATVPKAIAADDDILDAFAALWTAERVHAGTNVSLPPTPEFDAFGLPMEMCA